MTGPARPDTPDRRPPRQMETPVSTHPAGALPESDPHFPTLHRVHRSGWLNDPNGIHRHDGRWHVYFQHNPRSTVHEQIEWGHMSSPDLVTWREEPAGPRPRPGEADRGGCWSGVGLVVDGVPTLVYSGVDGVDDQLSRVILQRGDAQETRWTPVPGTVADVPEEPGLFGLRDPFLLELDGRRYAVQGAGLARPDGTHVPAILGWDATDLEDWRYLGPVLTGEHPVAAEHAPAQLWECPQLVPVDGRWVLMLSLWSIAEGPGAGRDTDAVTFLHGDLALQDGRLAFTPAGGGVVDHGPDFYAPQAVRDGDRTLLWGWSWEGGGLDSEQAAAQAAAQGWAGTLTVPRELHLHGDVLVSSLPEELRALRSAELPVPAEGGGVDLPAPARAETCAAAGLRLERVRADGTAETVLGPVEGAATLLADAGILELLPADAPASTLRIRVEDGEHLRVHGEDLQVWELAVPSEG